MGGNITVLEKEIEMHKEIEANLTSKIMLNQGRKIDVTVGGYGIFASGIGYHERSTFSPTIFLVAFSPVTIETAQVSVNEYT